VGPYQEDVTRLLCADDVGLNIFTRLTGNIVLVSLNIVAGTCEHGTDIRRRLDELFVAEQIAFSNDACQLVNVGLELLLKRRLLIGQWRQRTPKGVSRHADHHYTSCGCSLEMALIFTYSADERCRFVWMRDCPSTPHRSSGAVAFSLILRA
jgi:hypothetical protein